MPASTTEAPTKAPSPVKEEAETVDWTKVREVPLDRIEHGRNPRTVLELPRQKELAESVRQHGVLMPIRVRPLGDGTKFMIVAGHRRYEAAKSAKLPQIPVIVALPDDTSAFVQSLVENLQREDLDPIDEAQAYKQLLAETKWTQEVLGQKVGRSQSYVANSLRLLGLEPEVKQALTEGRITTSHAKAIVGLDADRQKSIAKQAIEQKLPSREIEFMVADAKARQKRDEEQAAQDKAAAEKAVKLVAEFVKKNGLAKDAVTFYVVGTEIDALKAAGWQVSRPNWQETVRSPAYKCDCTGLKWEYDRWRGISSVCVVPAHEAAYRKTRDAERRAAAATAQKETDKARSLIRKAIGEKDSLTNDGKRIALYVLLTSQRGGFGRTVDIGAFVKRYGGAPRTQWSSDYGDVWEVVEGMTNEDVVTELGKYLSAQVMPNVWSEATSGVEHDWKLRQYLVGKKVIGKEAVYGPKGVSQVVLDTDKKRLETAAAAVKAEREKEKPEPVKAEVTKVQVVGEAKDASKAEPKSNGQATDVKIEPPKPPAKIDLTKRAN